MYAIWETHVFPSADVYVVVLLIVLTGGRRSGGGGDRAEGGGGGGGAIRREQAYSLSRLVFSTGILFKCLIGTGKWCSLRGENTHTHGKSRTETEMLFLCMKFDSLGEKHAHKWLKRSSGKAARGTRPR